MMISRPWGWPQFVILGLQCMNIGMALIADGKPKEGTESFARTVIAAALNFIILRCGGFF